MIIRRETPNDYLAVERLTLAAFKTFTFHDGSKPHTDEHYLAHIMRDVPAFVRMTMPDGSVFEPFMAFEIQSGFLGADGGKWYEDDVYQIDQGAFIKWNKAFPQ